MSILWVDFETRSRCDLLKRGVYNYAQDASTDVLCMCYAFDSGEVLTWVPTDPFPEAVRGHTGLIYAHNAAFERLIFWYVLQVNFKLEQFYCTAAQARSNCLPGSLEDVGRALSSEMQKDRRGGQLIRLLSIPREDGTFNDDPVLMAEMVAYCAQDVATMRNVSGLMRPLSADELSDYHVNERINDRGALIDPELCQAAVRYAEVELEDIQKLVAEITKGEITTVRSPKMRQWVMSRVGPEALKLMKVYRNDVEKYSIDKTVRGNLLALAEENPDEVPFEVADVIQCADDLWASSVAKFKRLGALADEEDHRVRGAFVFAGGSATGRFCVAASTLVETEFGRCPISLIAVGRKVLTHSGRLCKVSHVVYKGTEVMYRVTTKNGAWVECTAGHQILTNLGWSKYEHKFESTKGSIYTVGSRAAVYDTAVLGWYRDSQNNTHDRGDGLPNSPGRHTERSSENAAFGQPQHIEEGREEPDVWGSEAGGGDTSEGVPLPVAGWRAKIRGGASPNTDEVHRDDAMAGRLGGAPHRLQPPEQPRRQPSFSDEAWASASALSEITEIVCVGKKGVWDITVDGDASYCAQGLIHHNSSFGAQVHNFTRKCAKDPAAVREAMLRGDMVVPQFGKRVTDVLKGMLRPAILAAPGKKLLVADWASIEARVNPWLSGSPAGQRKLDDFRKGLDAYIVNAAATFRRSYTSIAEEYEREGKSDARQIGKVQELACLGQQTQVLTSNGVKAIVDVTLIDKLWDGESWVDHQGLVNRGPRTTINVCGVQVTEDHLFLAKHEWLDAKTVLTSRRALTLALATGLENLPFWAMNSSRWGRAPTSVWYECNVLAGPRRTWFSFTTYLKARLRGAPPVLEKQQAIGARNFSNTQMLAPMMATGGGCLTGYPLARAGATTQKTRHTPTTAGAASSYTRRGAQIKLRSCATYAHLKDGMRRAWNWTASMLIKIMRRVIYGLLRTDTTKEIGEKYKTCSSVLPSLRPTFDILNSGPRSRFTILSNRGPLIVHNCGFGGAVGAFAAMGRIYGVNLKEAEAKRMVGAWREANPWAVGFWSELEVAYNTAMRNPGRPFRAGRIIYMFDRQHLWCALPSKRLICYPFARREADEITYLKAAWKPKQDAKEWPRARLWRGLACENITQAVAADILRHALRNIPDVVAHVHDEIVVECGEDRTKEIAETMCSPPAWADGLPLGVETKIMERYGK